MTSEESFNKETNDVISMANSAKEKRLRDEALENFKKNSLYSEGAEPVMCEQKKEEVSKKEYRKYLITLLVLSSLVVGTLGIKTIDWLNREKDLRDANDFMGYKIVSIYEKNDIPYVIYDGKVILMDEDYKKVSELSKQFEEKGFETHEFLYAVYKTGGIESLDKAVKGMGYSGVDNFLYEKYRDPDTGRGSLSRFENNNEVGYVNGVKTLQSKETNKLKDKGMSL